ncbi:hypothetical protein [Kitasatospora sp. NPDC051914]|uniref:hypothetical protein n=1 Tax=Kitasatospora sp. NPDC051914 TaxID=3154945 RepID=UPI00344301E4
MIAGAAMTSVLTAAAAVVVVGAWTAAVRHSRGALWAVAWWAGAERAMEEMVVKAVGPAAEHALSGAVPHTWALPAAPAAELSMITVLWVVRRRR